jgi:hypothetical protein
LRVGHGVLLVRAHVDNVLYTVFPYSGSLFDAMVRGEPEDLQKTCLSEMGLLCGWIVVQWGVHRYCNLKDNSEAFVNTMARSRHLFSSCRRTINVVHIVEL